MIDSGAAIVEWLAAEAPVAALIGPGLILLVHRTLSVIELWMILRLLPRSDRVTAVVAYFSSRSARKTDWTKKVPNREVNGTTRHGSF